MPTVLVSDPVHEGWLSLRIKSLYTSLLRYFVRVTPNIGEDQTWKPIGHAVQDAAEFFKPEQDSTLHIYSYNLPKTSGVNRSGKSGLGNNIARKASRQRSWSVLTLKLRRWWTP